MDKLFFIDEATGTQCSYEQLSHEVIGIAKLEPVHEFVSPFELFVNVVAAVTRDAQLALVPHAGMVQDCSMEGNLEGNRAIKRISETEGDGELAGNLGVQGGSGEKEKLGSAVRLNFDGANWNAIVQTSRSELGIMTSGSTGAPKLIWHGMDSLTRAVRVAAHHADDVWGLAYHPAHFAGLQVLFQALANRNTLVRLHGLEPTAVHQSIERHRLTHLSATPTFLNLLCTQHSNSHPSVKRITTGGERLPPPLIDRIARMFPNAKLTNVYASTETGSLLAADGEHFTVPADLQTKVKIIDGELAVHRSLLAKSVRTQGTGRVVGEFFLTGDQVERVETVNEPNSQADNSVGGIPSGTSPLRFRFLGRRQDEINVGGFKVNPLEIEERLLAMAEVAGARVYGRANSVTGYLVACDLVLQPGQTLTALQIRERLSPQLAAYQLPRIVKIVDSLPTTYSGKQARLN